jgi:hypothetical protein
MAGYLTPRTESPVEKFIFKDRSYPNATLEQQSGGLAATSSEMIVSVRNFPASPEPTTPQSGIPIVQLHSPALESKTFEIPGERKRIPLRSASEPCPTWPRRSSFNLSLYRKHELPPKLKSQVSKPCLGRYEVFYICHLCSS